MKLLDSRRYTGPNLVWDLPSAVMDIDCDVAQCDAIVQAWQTHLRAFLEALGFEHAMSAVHRFDNGGMSVALAAPIDQLYGAIDINEAAWRVAKADLIAQGFDVEPDPEDVGAELSMHASFEETVAALRERLAGERDPKLIALTTAAKEKGATLLWDDDEVSVGLGRHATVWPADQLPAPNRVDWAKHDDVPVGMVTGTNGKTTSVRMATSIVRAAQLNVGLSSTDWVGVNDRVIDRGDYSGPGGARAALRADEVDMAILETARGGLLRRGLGVDHADAVLITNIAEDHLGDFGSRDINELLDVKWIVTRALHENSVAILNADDPLLVTKSSALKAPVLWFSLDADNPTLAQHVSQGGPAFTLIDNHLQRCENGTWHPLCAINDIPLTVNGAARHNVANALGAAALTHCLGVRDEHIVAGLTRMTSADNPGRGNLLDVNGIEVLVDFAHNPQGMAAIFDLASRRPAKRRALAFGQAGDRTDESIREQARVAWACDFELILISELADYHRGRDYREVFGLLHDEFVKQGARSEQIQHFEQEIDALHAALAWAKPGDLIVMLALASAGAIMADLEQRGARPL
ncbi:MAG: Mur ligase family protein [Gammaproteobacteria bacterium]